jgi:hypothetical protein
MATSPVQLPGFYLKVGMHWSSINVYYGQIVVVSSDAAHATRYASCAEAEAMKAKLEAKWRAPCYTVVYVGDDSPAICECKPCWVCGGDGVEVIHFGVDACNREVRLDEPTEFPCEACGGSGRDPKWCEIHGKVNA